jgi:hypothetical protein
VALAGGRIRVVAPVRRIVEALQFVKGIDTVPPLAAKEEL